MQESRRNWFVVSYKQMKMRADRFVKKTGLIGKSILYCHRILAPRNTVTLINYLSNRAQYKAYPAFGDFIEVDPSKIQLWLTEKEYEDISRVSAGSIISGDWDKFAINLTMLRPQDNFDKAKQVSVRQRYAGGVAWRDTDLFVYHYSVMVHSGAARGYSDLYALERHYINTYDKLFDLIEKEGIRRPTLSNPWPSWMYLHIGRNGELIWSSKGNHRLAMAIVCGYSSIPVRVLARHAEWQKIKEQIASGSKIRSALDQHPDLKRMLQA